MEREKYNLDEYLAAYADPNPPVFDVAPDAARWPTIVVKRGSHALVLHLCAIDGDDDDPGSAHLFVDARGFVNNEEARTGVFAMEEGRQWSLPADKMPGKSHKWPAAMGITLLVGEQG